jgi:putative ABC transport system permease protein
MSARISWLDVKLGARMLLKHPALTLVGGLGMAVGIAVSVGFFSFMMETAFPTIPLDEGERIVALENRDVTINNEEMRSLHDFFVWRDELKTIEDVAAFRRVERNLIVTGDDAQAEQVAEMTAAGFRVARVPPLHGRYLLDEDESRDAPRVVVIGHEIWQTRFAGDPNVIGREVRLGGVVHTVVGVMPEGYAFPEAHRIWTPLRAQPSQFERRTGPEIFMFGRLAPGVRMKQAQAELDAIGARTAREFPESNAQLKPMVMPYVHSLVDVQGITLWNVGQMGLMTSLLLIVVALNVAVLVYARTALRQGEIAVRSALGATRGRIVAQLFAEALVLAMVSAVVGLSIARFGTGIGMKIMETEMDVGMPFWVDYGLKPGTIVVTVGLALLAAVIVGVLPGLQATGRRLQSDLRQLGGGTGVRLGRTWTVLIVTQVAIAVAALPMAVNTGWNQIRKSPTKPSYPSHEFLIASLVPERLVMSQDTNTFANGLTEVLRRVAAEPAVAGITFRASLAGRGPLIQVDGVPAPIESPAGHPVRPIGVDPGFFRVYDARPLTGRVLTAADAGESNTAIVVNETFVHRVLGGGVALGRRIRHVSEAELTQSDNIPPVRWFEIVGVIADLERNLAAPERLPAEVYYPVAPRQVGAASLVVRLRPGTTPADFGPRLRQLTAAVDPVFRLSSVRSLADADRQRKLATQLTSLAVGLVLLSVLLLSAAGIYALMSFTVTQRRREIGIRTALGAQPRQVLQTIFARAAMQIAAGVVVGVAIGVLVEIATGGGLVQGRGRVLFPGLALLMALVGLIAALGPARRGLRIQPKEALRAD